MRSVIYEYQIPDPERPVPRAERGWCGPSGELISFRPEPLDPIAVAGRRVDELVRCAGTYGMGGPGFVALRLASEWLVIAIWGAAEWITCRGRLMEDDFWEEERRPRPWITDDADELSPMIEGGVIETTKIARHHLRITFDRGCDITIDESPDSRPEHPGPGGPRAFGESDDLRKAVFLAPTTEIWVL
jgi:hypothetical protein